ncbi:MAG: hypothetical protein OEW19_10045, partial [Acidobacteriota bacterium]|nr:hypothetical protein [Acidobacteriota bacterium]
MTTTGAASPGPPASPRIKNAEATVTARFYDGAHHRLVYLGEEASPELWDNLWNANDEWISRMLRPSVGSRWLVRLTGRHLRPGDGLVLEGGCGSG